MFDFAVSQNQRPRPTKRLVASGILSCLTHVFILFIFIQDPWLLSGGVFHRFRGLSLISNILEPRPEDDRENFRTVTVLRPMMAPSEATLKKYLYDWHKNEAKNSTPPVRIRWGGELKAALKENAPPAPITQPKPTIPANDVAAGLAASQGAQSPTANPSDESSSGFPKVIQSDAGKKGVTPLPPPGPPAKTETAGNIAPSSIPNSTKQPSNAESRPSSDDQQATRRQGIAFFDNKGFAMGEYANLIKERIYGQWFIPSNLRNSQGHTTVVFFIDKDGRYTDARIVSSSGNYSLNLAALNAIINANPFPPLPQGFPGDHVGVRYIFSYNEPQ